MLLGSLHDVEEMLVFSQDTTCNVCCAIAGLSDAKSEEYANIWDKYLLKLNGYALSALRGRTMFEHLFHVIHMILKASRQAKGFEQHLDLHAAFVNDPIIDICQQPKKFMEHFFQPVAKAMDRIFNWRELKLPESEETPTTL